MLCICLVILAMVYSMAPSGPFNVACTIIIQTIYLDNHNTVIELAMQRRAAFSWAGQKAMRSLRSRSLRSRDALHLSSCERSELPSLFNARIFYIYINVYIFQAVRRAVNVRNPGHRLQQLRTAREPVFNS